MPDLDDYQLEVLDKMGVDIWQRRNRQTTEYIAQSGDSLKNPPNNQSGDQSDMRIDDAVVAAQSVEPLAEPKSSVRRAQPELTANVADNLPDSLDKVAGEVNHCQRCQLHTTRIKAVAGAGSRDAEWMFIGEAPGQNEDQQGLPFVGRAGQLLDTIIAALQMQRSNVFIANVIKCRPPANRDPIAEEVAACEPYLHRQLALVKPKIIVALGRVSAQALLKTSEPLAKLRGKVHHYGVANTPMIITYHPAYLLRSPGQKFKVWEDLLLAQAIVAGSAVNSES